MSSLSALKGKSGARARAFALSERWMAAVVQRMTRTPRGRKLLVFVWHNIISTTDTVSIGTREVDFVAQVDWLRRNFEILSLRDAVSRCANGTLSAPTVAFTFDDGYRNQKIIGSNILKHFSLPATFFVTSGHLGDSILWNERLAHFRQIADASALRELLRMLGDTGDGAARVAAVSEEPLEARIKYLPIAARKEVILYLESVSDVRPSGSEMMSAADVRELHETGFEIGGHTLDHPILKLESRETARQQIAEDLENLESIVGHRVRSFAFPNGMPLVDYSAWHLNVLAELGIDVALTSAFGHFSAMHDRMQVPRVTLRGRSPVGFLRSLRSACASNNPLLQLPSGERRP